MPYDATLPRLTLSDVDHLRLGGAITDMTGKTLIDPAVDDLVFVTIDRGGNPTIQLRQHSLTAHPAENVVGVIQPSGGADYASVVAVMDLIRRREPPVDTLWVSAPGDPGLPE